jgi:hypothetical protein
MFKGKGAYQMTGKAGFSAAALKRIMDDIQHRPIEDLILGDGKVFGARYYTVEPIGGNWLEMEKWAISIYGDPASIWEQHNFIWPECGRWYMNNRKFWFRNESDRTVFVMKWCN